MSVKRVATQSGTRTTLTRDRVLEAAIELADASGIESLSMRVLGAHLGVEAMSLYNHVANKDDLLNGMCDLVWRTVDLARTETDWQAALRTIAISVHDAFLAHPWAAREHGTRMSETRLRYVDAQLAHLESGGLNAEAVFHAHHTLDGYILGYSLQVIDFTGEQPEAEALFHSLSHELPSLTEHFRQHGLPQTRGFEVGLDLILDGLVYGNTSATRPLGS